MQLPRYRLAARWYDALSGERLVYRLGRSCGIAAARLRSGDAVLDVGCGTGLNLPPVLAAVGPSGRYIGLDASAAMLRSTQARAIGRSQVRSVVGDAADLTQHVGADAPFDAVLFTYTLSIIGAWRSAFAQALALTRPGGRIVVVDMSWPAGRWRVFAPLAALAFVVGGVHPRRAPWRLVQQHCTGVTHDVVRGGHVHIVSGVVR